MKGYSSAMIITAMLMVSGQAGAWVIKCDKVKKVQLCKGSYIHDDRVRGKKTEKWTKFKIVGSNVDVQSICLGMKYGSLEQRECRRETDKLFQRACMKDKGNNKFSQRRQNLYCNAASRFIP